jgi:hypothetical protein
MNMMINLTKKEKEALSEAIGKALDYQAGDRLPDKRKTLNQFDLDMLESLYHKLK